MKSMKGFEMLLRKKLQNCTAAKMCLKRRKKQSDRAALAIT